MKTMEQVCPVGSQSAVRASQDTDSSFDENVYHGIRLTGPDPDKLVALCDAVLFYVQVARLRTRPVTISEAEGCVTLRWSRYAPAVFRHSRMLQLIAGGEYIDHLTVQESRAA